MDVNFTAVVAGTRAFLPAVKAAAGQGHPAWIVNVSSVFGMMAYPLQSAYNASKFAVRGFTEALRIELEITDPGVTVIQVHPGGIKTNIAKSAKVIGGLGGVPMDNAMAADRFEQQAKTKPEQAAQTIIAGMARLQPRVLIGPDAKLIDWVTRLFPVRYFKVLGKLAG
jgi:short-subunit dehydrogenase